jgi:hypothetical protein
MGIPRIRAGELKDRTPDDPPLTGRQVGSLVRHDPRRPNPVNRDIRHGTILSLWMKRWLLRYVENPGWTAVERHKAMQWECKHEVTFQAPEWLLKREDARAYVDQISAGPLAVARAKAEAALPTLIDIHVDAAQAALAERKLGIIPQYTLPAWDRVMPVNKGPQVATQVTVMLGARQRQALEVEAVPIIEAEAIKAEVEP